MSRTPSRSGPGRGVLGARVALGGPLSGEVRETTMGVVSPTTHLESGRSVSSVEDPESDVSLPPCPSRDEVLTCVRGPSRPARNGPFTGTVVSPLYSVLL